MIGKRGERFIITNLYSNFFILIDKITSVFEIETILKHSLSSPNFYNNIKSVNPISYNEKVDIHTQQEYHKYNLLVLMCMVRNPFLYCYFIDLALHG